MLDPVHVESNAAESTGSLVPVIPVKVAVSLPKPGMQVGGPTPPIGGRAIPCATAVADVPCDGSNCGPVYNTLHGKSHAGIFERTSVWRDSGSGKHH